MAAVLQFEQATAPAGPGPGFAFTRGTVIGQVVTVSSVGSATTHEARILNRPADDSGAVLVQTGPTTWTFTPNPSGGIPTGGAAYRVELVTDRGLPSEARTIRVFAVRDSNSLLLPPYGSKADPEANVPDLAVSTSLTAFLRSCEMNEPIPGNPYGVAGNPFGWDPDVRAFLQAAAGGSGPGSLLWSWNRADLSEVDVANAFTAGVISGVNATLVTRETGPAIRIEGTRSSGSGEAVVSVPLIVGLDLGRAYRVVWRMRQATTDEPWQAPDWAGLEFLSNGEGSGRYGITVMSDKNGGSGTAGSARLIENDVWAGSDWTTFNSFGFDDATAPEFGTWYEYQVQANLTDTEPEGAILHKWQGEGNIGSRNRQFIQGDFSGWTPTELTTIGIAMRDLSAGNDPIAVEVSDVAVFSV